MHHRPRKRFGQNFLEDPFVIEQIIDLVDPHPDETLVEIGPGKGALTNPLLESGCHLHVLELDRDLAAIWEQRALDNPRLEVHQTDALKVDFAAITQGQKLRLVGNLPYNISTPLLFHFFDHYQCFEDLHVMLQQEVAARICAAPGSKTYGRITVMLATRFECEMLLTVPPAAFNPQPKVTSTIIRLKPAVSAALAINDSERFAAIVRQAFSQRRKTLRKSLRGFLPVEVFDNCDIDAGLRPEALSPEQFVRLANCPL